MKYPVSPVHCLRLLLANRSHDLGSQKSRWQRPLREIRCRLEFRRGVIGPCRPFPRRCFRPRNRWSCLRILTVSRKQQDLKSSKLSFDVTGKNKLRVAPRPYPYFLFLRFPAMPREYRFNIMIQNLCQSVPYDVLNDVNGLVSAMLCSIAHDFCLSRTFSPLDWHTSSLWITNYEEFNSVFFSFSIYCFLLWILVFNLVIINQTKSLKRNRLKKSFAPNDLCTNSDLSGKFLFWMIFSKQRL